MELGVSGPVSVCYLLQEAAKLKLVVYSFIEEVAYSYCKAEMGSLKLRFLLSLGSISLHWVFGVLASFPT